MKRNIYIFIVLSLALALPSCKIGKKYALPELDLPEGDCGRSGYSFDRQHLLAEPVCRYDFATSDYHRSR